VIMRVLQKARTAQFRSLVVPGVSNFLFELNPLIRHQRANGPGDGTFVPMKPIFLFRPVLFL